MTEASRQFKTELAPLLNEALPGEPMLAWMYEEQTWTPPDLVERVEGINPFLRRALNAESSKALAYPAGAYNGSCDIVARFEGQRLWLEVKQLQSRWSGTEPHRRNHLYPKWLMSTDEDSCLRDLHLKLPTLVGKPGVDLIGFLIVAYESRQHPIPISDIEALERAAELDGAWNRDDLGPWQSPRQEAETLKAFYWERPGHA